MYLEFLSSRSTHERTSGILPGFTLVELMIMVFCVVALSALLIPLLQARSMALTVSCMKRQQQIYQGITAYESTGESFDIHQNWRKTLQEFLEDEQKVFLCPEPSEFEPFPLLEAKIRVRASNSEIYTIDIFEGPFGRRLSETQYSNALATYGDFPNRGGISPWDPFFDGSGPYVYNGYMPDKSNIYYMMMEDIQQNGMPGGDQDFDDLIFKVTPTRPGYAQLEPMKGTTGYTQSLVDYYNTDMVLIDNIQFEETRGFEIGLSDSDYGLNIHYKKSIPDTQIVIMDFERSIIDPSSPWRQYQNLSQYSFARHSGKVNVTFADGHSETLSPEAISPELNTEKEMLHLWGK